MRGQGFTLIEILIVLVIISIVTTIALTNLRVNENRHLENFTNELSQLISLVEEQALLRPSVLAMKIDKDSYEFFWYKSDINVEKKESPWVSLDDDELLAKHKIPDDIALRIETGDDGKDVTEEETDSPQIVFSTNGDLTPFAIYVGAPGKDPQYVVRGEADGTIKAKKFS